MGTLGRELCRNDWNDQDAVWGMNLGRSKKASVRWGFTLAPRGEYDRTVHVRRRCGLVCQIALTTCLRCGFSGRGLAVNVRFAVHVQSTSGSRSVDVRRQPIRHRLWSRLLRLRRHPQQRLLGAWRRLSRQPEYRGYYGSGESN